MSNSTDTTIELLGYTPSDCTDTEGAVDASVLVQVGSKSFQCEVTLCPRQYDSKLDTWGDLDNWASEQTKLALDAAGDDRQDVIDTIVALIALACDAD